MISVKDIMVILDKIPIWKQLIGLPSRIEALEKRVSELESKGITTGDSCPKCKAKTFELISTAPDPLFGEMGVQKRLYKCSACGFEESKNVDTFAS
ncbi:hypothetical protein [Methyloglobulus sp.]|uniref:hypothetical protein n=1 Tax=Methyloglobulus sp. TaxID=2518622 RepID=UPI0032B7296B